MIQKGDIYYILPFDGGSRGYRAAVIVSSVTEQDKVSVAYLSSRKGTEQTATHVFVQSSGRHAKAILDGVTTLPISRLGDKIGQVTPEELAAIDSGLCVAFGL